MGGVLRTFIGYRKKAILLPKYNENPGKRGLKRPLMYCIVRLSVIDIRCLVSIGFIGFIGFIVAVRFMDPYHGIIIAHEVSNTNLWMRWEWMPLMDRNNDRRRIAIVSWQETARLERVAGANVTNLMLLCQNCLNCFLFLFPVSVSVYVSCLTLSLCSPSQLQSVATVLLNLHDRKERYAFFHIDKAR